MISGQWTVAREQRTENREQGTGNREQGTEIREQRTGNRDQGTEIRDQGSVCGFQHEFQFRLFSDLVKFGAGEEECADAVDVTG